MNWNLIFRIGKVVTALLMIVLIFPAFQSVRYSAKDFKEVQETTLSGIDMSKYPTQDPLSIKRYFGLNPSDYLQISFYRTDDAMDAEELLIAQFDNEQAKENFEASALNRKRKQTTTYEGYAPDQYALASEGRLKVEGNYGIYVVGKQADQAVSQFEAGL